MRVNVICHEANDGWIYGKFCTKLGLYSRHKIYLNASASEKCDLLFYLPYYSVCKNNTHPVTAWFSHRELADPLKSKFLSAAGDCDWCFSPALKYVELLKSNSIQHVSQVHHGVDLDLYRPQPIKPSSKLVVGWVGRSYASTTRKNEQLLRKIGELDFVDLMITGGKVAESDMPRFYGECDLIASSSLVEGGPMSITESLACGRPVLCYAGVGVADEFEHGVIRAVYNDEIDFLGRLRAFWVSGKDYYRQSQTQQLLRSQVEQHTWESFCQTMDDVWQSLV
jgi:glycosyltransferase involved in cell wall biosynthesis